MTRKINVDLTHSIGTFMSKVNQFSDFIGDLDNLDSSFANAHADSNIVSALNHVGTLIDSLNDHLFGDSPGAIINRLTVGEAIIDSAVIDSATITHAYITNFNMNDQGGSNVELDNLKLFTVKNESGTIVMSGHFLSTSDDITIP